MRRAGGASGAEAIKNAPDFTAKRAVAAAGRPVKRAPRIIAIGIRENRGVLFPPFHSNARKQSI
ncbi:MAG: hypothetical protein LBG43_01475 [Treponema sp.]|jgi:hypothetical protein|nr:hypothetical protein [Treponema sp.]